MRSIPVLMYHHVSPRRGAYTVSPRCFGEQLDWLLGEGYRCLTGDEFRYFRTTGQLPSDRCVLLTFDDGWLDNWVYAAPLLQERGLTSLLFVVSQWIGNGPIRSRDKIRAGACPSHAQAMTAAARDEERDQVMMRWSELLRLQELGVFELQCHSHSHGLWWAERSRSDVLKAFAEDVSFSRRLLLQNTGQEPSHFCWPRGQFSHSMRRIACDIGFDLQYSTLRGANIGRCSPMRQVRRLNVEDRPLAWLASRIQLYSCTWKASWLGRTHQVLSGRRMLRRYGSVLGADEFKCSFWEEV